MTSRTSHFAACLTAAALIASVHAAGAQQTRAFITTTDFMTGSIAEITFGPPRVPTADIVATSSDPVVRWYSGLVYVVNRVNHDNIQVLDPAQGFAVVRQFSVGNGANPHDIEFASTTRAFVTRYDMNDLLVVDPSTGAVLDSISLAPFADADGIPEMDHLALRHGRLFVSVQRLDRNNFYAPAGGSQVVVIDVNTHAIIDADPGAPGTQGILLPAQNPYTELVVDPAGDLVVGCVGSYGAQDGRVVRIDPVTFETTTECTEAALGGDLSDVAVLDATHGFAIISDDSFNTILKSYRRDLGTAQTITSTSGFSLGDIEVNDRAELWMCDRSFGGPGIRIYDAVTHALLTPSPIGTGLPPIDIVFDFAPSLVAVDPPAAPAAGWLSLGRVQPNPSRGAVRLSLEMGVAASGDIRVEIVDVTGRTCWSTTLPATGAGEYPVTWNGRMRDGREAPAGIYFVRAHSAAATASGRLVRIH